MAGQNDILNEMNEESNQFTPTEIGADDYLKCALCGQELQFSHKMDYMTLRVKEEAHCVCCKVRMKSRDYIIQ